MSSKQDRQGVRTATDLERKYQFGKTFAELMGIAMDARNKVDSVESSLHSEIKEQYTTIMRDTEQILLKALESYSKTSDLEEFERTVQSELKIMADGITAKVTANEKKITETADSLDKFEKDTATELQVLESSITAKVTANETAITKVGNDLTEYKNTASSQFQVLDDAITAQTNTTTQKFTKVEGDIRTVSGNLATYQNSSNAFKQAIEKEVDDAVERIAAAEGELANQMTVNSQFKQTTESELGVLTDRITMGVQTATEQIVEVSGALGDVKGELEEQFTAQETFKEKTESDLSLLSDQVSMNFQTHTEQITNINGEVQSVSEHLEKHFEFGTNGLVIKAGEGSMELLLDNDIIHFQKDGQEFGWWDGVNFHTGNVMIEVNERAQFGNFALVPRSNGSLSFLKVGG